VHTLHSLILISGKECHGTANNQVDRYGPAGPFPSLKNRKDKQLHNGLSLAAGPFHQNFRKIAKLVNGND
jgi:hypothetical protein